MTKGMTENAMVRKQVDATVCEGAASPKRFGMFTGRCAIRLRDAVRGVALEERAQGTTEYAILVGVLVVIAILAIIAFRDKVSELWDAIASGINSL